MKIGVPRKLINLTKLTVGGSKCEVRIYEDMSEPFEVVTGVRQSDRMSPLLFNISGGCPKDSEINRLRDKNGIKNLSTHFYR